MKHQTELKKFVKCPACDDGEIVHSGGHYFCTTDNSECNFMIRSDQYGAKITKTMMVSLIRKRYLEPMFIGLKPYQNSDKVNGFIVISKYNKVEFLYPNYFPIVKCPKCKKEDIFMKYSDKTEDYFYACKDYKSCKFSLPYLFRNKPFNIKDIQKLCKLEKISKTYLSKNEKGYTVNVFLDENLKVKAIM